MRDYVIFTDATADLWQDMARDLAIQVLPMEFSFSAEEHYLHYSDYREMSEEDFFSRLAQAQPTTSQIGVGDYINAFTPVLEQGLDIFYIAFSSGGSGLVNSARLAMEELRARYPEATILVLDSLCFSLGEGLLVWYAAQNKAAGLDIQANYDWCQANLGKVAHWFTVADLYHLMRGGRCSAASAFLGSMLSIKPVLHVSASGHLEPVEKVRSMKKCLERMVEIMAETALDPASQTVFIGHGHNAADAERLASLVEAACHPKEIKIGVIGPIISAHCGVGTIALFYLANQR